MRFSDPKFRFTKRLGKVPEVQTVEFVIPAHVKLLALVGRQRIQFVDIQGRRQDEGDVWCGKEHPV